MPNPEHRRNFLQDLAQTGSILAVSLWSLTSTKQLYTKVSAEISENITMS